ncbi:MAG: AAA-like domain-containing protein [Oscillospiraceae bacterium]|nr:AAA-like domain-containing protein [Oscillospiraceae bacterium]
MERFFNIAGPMVPERNYCIDPLSRLDWEEAQRLIRDNRYFVLHAPRQTGKTSTLMAMMQELNVGNSYACAYTNIETAQTARNDVARGIAGVCETIASDLSLYLQRSDIEQWFRNEKSMISPENQLVKLLEQWTSTSEKPTVLFIDEIDSLVGDTLISVLRQLRAGYNKRPTAFPQSIILCGVRDVRDYRINQGDGEIITGGSAFNIKTESIRMGNFTQKETGALWRQHTEETGQSFSEAIFPELWEDTFGQPWLVNALGYEVTWKLIKCRNRDLEITLSDYKEARENLIQSRATHLDQLMHKLEEPRVQRVLEAILTGETNGVESIRMDDQKYVEDMGLIQTKPTVSISNRIYREVIPRELVWVAQTRIPNQETAWYVTSERKLDMYKLLSAFQQFFREHADSWVGAFGYEEAGPQLLMQAFLQRIVNGGGYISREYGIGRKRTDLYIEWPLDEKLGMRGSLQRIVIELKLRRGALETVIEKGLEQTADYARQVGADEAHLFIFDREDERTWDERIWRRDERHNDMQITVWGA